MEKILIDCKYAKEHLPKREKETDKNSFGRVCIFAGSLKYPGAPYLSSSSAFRSGAGVVALYVPEQIFSILSTKLTCVIVRPISSQDGTFSCPGDNLSDEIKKYKAILIGPGLDISASISAFVQEIGVSSRCPLILDADALNNLKSEDLELISKKRGGNIVITPHAREYARLFGGKSKPSDVNLQKCSDVFGITIVYKDYTTRIVSPGMKMHVLHNPNSALSKAGSGDVLAGLILSFISQGLGNMIAAALAVYVHNHSAKAAAEKLTEYCVTPLDYIDNFPEIFKKLKKS